MQETGQTFLVIESAVLGGSTALFMGAELIAAREGSAEQPRSDDILINIADLLESNEILLSQLDSVIVSRGPGSFTGIRIGLATAMGLGMAGKLFVGGVSLLDAMALQAPHSKDTIAALPMGRNDVSWQKSAAGSESCEPRSQPFPDFLAELYSIGVDELVAPPSLIDRLKDAGYSGVSTHNPGTNLASVIGSALIHKDLALSGLKPIYISRSS